MVLTVNANPNDRRSHEREISARTNEIFEPFGDDERLVSEKAVVAQRYANSVPDVPEDRPCGNDQTVGDDRVFKDSQNDFLLVVQCDNKA